MALYMAICIWIITADMIDVHYASPAKPGGALQAAGLMLAQSIPLMLVLFILFPRVQGPLWKRCRAAAHDRSVGHDARLGASANSASRTRSHSVSLSRGRRRSRGTWNCRGPVLTDYDGRTWHAPPFDLAIR